MKIEIKYKRYIYIIYKLYYSVYPNLDDLLKFLFDNGLRLTKRTLRFDIDRLREEYAISIKYNRKKKGYFIDPADNSKLQSFLKFKDLIDKEAILLDVIKGGKNVLQCIIFDYFNNRKINRYIKTLLNAIIDQREITIDYEVYDTKEIQRFTIHPYLLQEYQNKMYLTAKVDRDFKVFEIERINDLVVRYKKFKRDRDFKDYKQLFGFI